LPQSRVTEEFEEVAVTVGTMGNVAVSHLALRDEGKAFDVNSVLLANFSDERGFVNVEFDSHLQLWISRESSPHVFLSKDVPIDLP